MKRVDFVKEKGERAVKIAAIAGNAAVRPQLRCNPLAVSQTNVSNCLANTAK
jgi:hypothetical protein